MTKEEIIKTIIVALIGAFSKSIFDNLLGKYIPDKKKLNSFIWKFLLFNCRYTLAAYFLITSFLDKSIIDKFFVFKVSILTAVVFFNILFDVLTHYTIRILNIIEKQDATERKIINVLNRLSDELITQVEINKQITDKLPDK